MKKFLHSHDEKLPKAGTQVMKYIKSKIFQRNINILVYECSNSNLTQDALKKTKSVNKKP